MTILRNHWIWFICGMRCYDAFHSKAQRKSLQHPLVKLDSGGYGANRVYILNFNPETGELQLDERFRASGSDQPGVNMDGKFWPHGFEGDAFPHGAVFSLTAAAAK